MLLLFGDRWRLDPKDNNELKKRNVFGYSPDALIGQTFLAIFGPTLQTCIMGNKRFLTKIHRNLRNSQMFLNIVNPHYLWNWVRLLWKVSMTSRKLNKILGSRFSIFIFLYLEGALSISEKQILVSHSVNSHFREMKMEICWFYSITDQHYKELKKWMKRLIGILPYRVIQRQKVKTFVVWRHTEF